MASKNPGPESQMQQHGSVRKFVLLLSKGRRRSRRRRRRTKREWKTKREKGREGR
jgi:hypothetical protein